MGARSAVTSTVTSTASQISTCAPSVIQTNAESASVPPAVNAASSSGGWCGVRRQALVVESSAPLGPGESATYHVLMTWPDTPADDNPYQGADLSFEIDVVTTA